MHFGDVLYSPVNFFISFFFLVSFGLVTTSIVLNNADLPDPITGFGEIVGLLVLNTIYGSGPVATSTRI